MTESILSVAALLILAAGAWFFFQQIMAERDQARGELKALRAENLRLTSELAAAQAATGARSESEEARFTTLVTKVLDATQQKYTAAAQGSVKDILQPTHDQLAKLALQVEAFEKSRLHDKATLDEQLRSIGSTLKDTQNVTGKLAHALRQSPKARGRWGEHSLRNALEMGGLTPQIDFEEQTTVEGDAGKLRPDLVIKMPGGRTIVIDSKVAISAFLDAIEAPDETARELLMKKHAAELRAHMKGLTTKEYWRHFDTADFVVMFVPGDNLVSAAFENDPSLQEDAFKQRVIIASPTMMVALARTVAYGWRQEQSSKNAQEIADLGRDVYRRLVAMWGNLGDLGKQIGGTVEKYNAFVGSLDRSVLPQAKKFRELGAAEGSEIVQPPLIETRPRDLPAPPEQLELTPPPASAKRGR